MKNSLLLLFLIVSIKSVAQSDTIKKSSSIDSTFKISAYLETYYAYDFGNPSNHKRPDFVYSFNRHNEVNINIGLIKIAYETKNVRANLGMMVGTYANTNLASEPGVLKNIFEANAGVKISKTKNLWIDAGIFSSHIGFESAIGADCWNLTRSMLADNSPYYESGAKISFTSDNEKWFLSGLFLNGWQRIQRINGNNTPAFGHQLTFSPNKKMTFNSSSFVGNTQPDSIQKMRYFHNFYSELHMHQKVGLIIGFDIGVQQKSKGSSSYNTWYSPVLILKYSPTNRVNIAARGEYYSDVNGVIINMISSDGANLGFETVSYSLNFDYRIINNATWRIEARGFNSKENLFLSDNTPSSRSYLLTTSLAISF